MEVAEMRKARFRAVRPLVSRAPQFAGKRYSSPSALWQLPRTLSTDCRENRRLAGLTICSATYRPAETCAVPLPLIGISRRHQDLRRSCRQHYVRVEVDATRSGSRSLLNDILANSCHWTLLRICDQRRLWLVIPLLSHLPFVGEVCRNRHSAHLPLREIGISRTRPVKGSRRLRSGDRLSSQSPFIRGRQK